MIVHLLNDLYGLVDRREPMPLSWVVADAFPSAWASSDDPQLMLRIAAHVVTRRQLVMATCAVARTALRFVKKNKLHYSLRAIETAEAWVRGEATIEEVRMVAAAADAAASAGAGYADADVAAGAGYYVVHAAYYAACVVFTTSAAGVAEAAAAAAASVDYAAEQSYRKSAHIVRKQLHRKSAQIIRKHIHITVADLVRAGRNGWEP